MIGTMVARILPRKRNTTIATRDERFKQSLDDFVYGIAHEDSRIINGMNLQSLGKARAGLIERCFHAIRGLNSVCSGSQVDANPNRRRAIKPAIGIGVLGPHLDACHIPHAEHRAVRASADHDIAELLWRRQTSLCLHVHLELLIGGDRARTNPADRCLDILSLNGTDDIRWRKPETCQPATRQTRYASNNLGVQTDWPCPTPGVRDNSSRTLMTA